MSIDEDEEAGRKRLVAYRLMAETAEKAQDRRQAANNFFIVMNGVIAGGYAFMLENDHFQLIKYTAVAGGIICLLWLMTLLYYRALLSAKFAIMAEYEKANELPGFDYEWRLFSRSFMGRLRIFDIRISLSTIEMVIAVLAFAAHVAAPSALHRLVKKPDVQHIMIEPYNEDAAIEAKKKPPPPPVQPPAPPPQKVKP